MFNLLKLFIFLSLFTILSNCSEKVTYSGKIFKEVKIDYRPVTLSTMTNDVQTFPPKERVY